MSLAQSVTDSGISDGYRNANLAIESRPDDFLAIYNEALDYSETYSEFSDYVDSCIKEVTNTNNNCNVEHSDWIEAFEAIYNGGNIDDPKINNYRDRALQMFGREESSKIGRRMCKELRNEVLSGEVREDEDVMIIE